MKPIKSRTFLVQNLLVVLAITLTVLGWFLSMKTIGFFPSLQAELVNNEIAVQIIRATMPLSHLFLFSGFLCVYLIFEFYSLKPALYTSLNLAVGLAVCFVVGLILRKFLLNPSQSHTDLIIEQFFVSSQTSAVVFCISSLLCFATALVVAFFIKVLTRNYFMFIRFSVAAVFGFFIFTLINISALKVMPPTRPEFVIQLLTPLSQFLALIVFSVVPLYLLRLLLGIFRGWEDKGQGLAASTQTAPSSPFKTPVQSTPPSEPPEETVSQKMALGQIAQKSL